MGEQFPSRWLYKHTLHSDEVDIRKCVPWFLLIRNWIQIWEA